MSQEEESMFKRFINVGSVGVSSCVVQNIGKYCFAIVAIRNLLYVYHLNSLRLAHVSSELPDEINCLACSKSNTFVAVKSQVHVFARHKKVQEFEVGHESIHNLHATDDKLIAYSHKSSTIFIFTIPDDSSKCFGEPSSHVFGQDFVPNVFCTADYRIILGCGRSSLLYDSRCSVKFPLNSFDADILVISRVSDCLYAFGCENGFISIVNVPAGSVVCTMKNCNASVSCMASCGDSCILAVGDDFGDVCLWDIRVVEIPKLKYTKAKAHHGRVFSVHFVGNGNTFLSFGCDNALHVWSISSNSDVFIVNSRIGHNRPISQIQFSESEHNNGSCMLNTIISAGSGGDIRRFEINRGGLGKEFRPPKDMLVGSGASSAIRMFSLGISRGNDWFDVIACYEYSIVGYTWISNNHSSCGRPLSIPKHVQNNLLMRNSYISCICVSACGNFCVVGHDCGEMHKYNMQSGRYRHEFCDYLIGSTAHKGKISGLCCDLMNNWLISSSVDGLVKLWNFRSGTHVSSMGDYKKTPINHLRLSRVSQLVAASYENNDVKVLDYTENIEVRHFTSISKDRVSDMQFSPSGSLLFVATMDGNLWTYNISSGRCIDILHTNMPVVSLSLSPGEEFLATSEVGSREISLWYNKRSYLHHGHDFKRNNINKCVHPHFKDVDNSDENVLKRTISVLNNLFDVNKSYEIRSKKRDYISNLLLDILRKFIGLQWQPLEKDLQTCLCILSALVN